MRLRGRSKILARLQAVKRRIPILSDVRLNFITLHYSYIIAVAILCSIVLYPGGVLSYTDALFFAVGSATQSGLNTVDVNKLHTYQQVFLWLGSMVANPIVIHSFLVFVRLYWFEKRFQHVVRQAKTLRLTKSRQRTMPREDDHDRAERGIRGRDIVVLRDASGHAQGHFLEPGKHKLDSTSEDSEDTARQRRAENAGAPSNERFGTPDRDAIPPGPDESAEPHLPTQRSAEHHIAFVENQRRERGALRIPSPREFDRGGMPQSIDENEDNELTRRMTAQSEQHYRPTKSPPSSGLHIKIDEPEIVRRRRTSTGFPRLGSGRAATTERGAREHGDLALPSRTTTRRSTLTTFLRSLTQEAETMPYLSWQPTLGRNSAFVDLTEEQRNELGGIEYRALKTLAKILIFYFIFFHVMGIVCLVPWILHTRYGRLVEEVGQGRPWWAIFMSGSAFNDQGYSIHPDSMIPFQDAIFPLLLMTFLIIIGNTGFPCILRLVIWILWKLSPSGSALWEELHFLLDHPRRCFTLLFPRSTTWWLFGVLVLLNGIDLIFFIILDINDPDISHIPGGTRVVDGLFQAAATRTAGLAAVNIAQLHPAMHVSYVVMMYISVYPIAISMRKTNVYEERSLGVYYDPDEDEDEAKEPSYVGTHLRKQLSFDLWYIFLGVFLIAIIEGSRLDTTTDHGFTMWGILFEVVSAYGTVGLSLGYPGTSTSLSAQFRVLSKLVIIAMMIRGRHRGLPYAVDRAVLLPSESLHRKEAADAAKRSRRRSSVVSSRSAVIGQTPPGRFRPETGLSSSVNNPAPTWRRQNWGRPGQESTVGTGTAPIPTPNTPSSHVHADYTTEISPSSRSDIVNTATRLPTHRENDE
ncbi:hypothetical protein VTO42DRAFT_2680 [Malbranchea cinnamomea]